MRLGERIRALRNARGWRQEDQSMASEIRKALLSDLETGRNTDPRWSVLAKLARAFGMSVPELLQGVDDIVQRSPAGMGLMGVATIPADPTTPMTESNRAKYT